MKNIYFREQRHICGDNYETAGYMEVDLFAVTPKQHKESARAKRKEATCLTMQTYNDNMALRYHVQLVNTNFSERDFAFTATYDDAHLPKDEKRADMDWTNFVKRLDRFCDKKGITRPLWIVATEYRDEDECGRVIGRYHHHAIIQRVKGLDREVLESLWRDCKGKRMGFVRCEALQFDHGSVESLVRYISKNRRCKRKWRQARGLKKPLRPKPNDTKWSRKKLEEASTLYVDDRAFWEKTYPGYTLNRVETKVTANGHRHTVVILRRADFKTAAANRRRRNC